MSMTGYERIKALLEGKPIDRSPIASWYHFPLVDHNITDFSRALICSTDFFGWDFIKIMTCGHFMTEAYGADITYSTNPQQWYGTVHRYAAYAVREDLLDPEAPPRLFRQALKLLNGQVDILVNNAGIQRRHKSEEFPLEDFDDVLQVNLRAVFRLSQLAGREMLRRGHGKIINVASMNSYFGGMLIPAYAASKAGVAAITRTLNNEWMSQGVSVNAIAPGYMATDMCAALQQDERRNQNILARIPAGRWGTPNDVKGLAVFLASAASDYIGGAIIPIDGGYLAC